MFGTGLVVAMLISGTISLLGFWGVFYFWRRIHRSTESALGNILEVKKTSDGDAGWDYTACIRFRYGGSDYKMWLSSLPSHSEGDDVTVYFPPNQPELAMIGRWQILFPYIVIGTFGVILFVGVILTSPGW